VALEVGNIEEALSFYGSLFEFSLRGRSAKMAFIRLRSAAVFAMPRAHHHAPFFKEGTLAISKMGELIDHLAAYYASSTSGLPARSA
jgi:hypothetical protein